MCGLGWARRQQTWSVFFSLSSKPTQLMTSLHEQGPSWGGLIVGSDMEGCEWRGGGGLQREDCTAPAALLVSSMAADTCSASSAPPTSPPTYPPWGSSGLCVFSSLSRRGPGAHQWCLCCSSGGHLLAESESRSTLGMELSSPKYQDCGERRKKRHTARRRD